MPLSASTLFHFTDSKDSIKKILEENFKVFYCKETPHLGDNKLIFYVPMVSFCDIPLSEVKEHISKYGKYGIGLTKNWGGINGLNPVLYVSKNSFLSTSYICAARHFADVETLDDLSNEQKSLVDVLRYIKSYEADLTRKGITTPNYRFSDEREWRFVPPHSESCPMIIDQEFYTNNKDFCDKSLSGIRLAFEPNDIKYIIINDDSEITEFLDHLRHTKGKTYSFHDVERLMTRILTFEQIRDDI